MAYNPNSFLLLLAFVHIGIAQDFLAPADLSGLAFGLQYPGVPYSYAIGYPYFTLGIPSPRYTFPPFQRDPYAYSHEVNRLSSGGFRNYVLGLNEPGPRLQDSADMGMGYAYDINGLLFNGGNNGMGFYGVNNEMGIYTGNNGVGDYGDNNDIDIDGGSNEVGDYGGNNGIGIYGVNNAAGFYGSKMSVDPYGRFTRGYRKHSFPGYGYPYFSSASPYIM